ncbi:hypothetical protein PUMCH_004336 [Australozyma saopauloensis]|uniref:Uncharacterized protein n=1 Tax=Australozyma saopauloensis TaxID=291208 RepID=A0AAX4HEH3_9ASCO|nr:hypothetical protein PUMCH_004336 [[Candida] saopauloensis]
MSVGVFIKVKPTHLACGANRSIVIKEIGKKVFKQEFKQQSPSKVMNSSNSDLALDLKGHDKVCTTTNEAAHNFSEVEADSESEMMPIRPVSFKKAEKASGGVGVCENTSASTNDGRTNLVEKEIAFWKYIAKICAHDVLFPGEDKPIDISVDHYPQHSWWLELVASVNLSTQNLSESSKFPYYKGMEQIRNILLPVFSGFEKSHRRITTGLREMNYPKFMYFDENSDKWVISLQEYELKFAEKQCEIIAVISNTAEVYAKRALQKTYDHFVRRNEHWCRQTKWYYENVCQGVWYAIYYRYYSWSEQIEMWFYELLDYVEVGWNNLVR